jgi:hypothetical protein
MSARQVDEAVALPVHNLEENELIIERGLRTFVEVANALAEIKRYTQYLELDYPSFEAYCKAEFGFSPEGGDR